MENEFLLPECQFEMEKQMKFTRAFFAFPGFSKKMSECQTKAGNQNTLTHSLTLSLSHSHSLTLSLSYSLTLDMLNNFCFHVYAQKSLSHFHTLALSHSQSRIHSRSTC